MNLVKRALWDWLKGHTEKHNLGAFVEAQKCGSLVSCVWMTRIEYENTKKTQRENNREDLTHLKSANNNVQSRESFLQSIIKVSVSVSLFKSKGLELR